MLYFDFCFVEKFFTFFQKMSETEDKKPRRHIFAYIGFVFVCFLFGTQYAVSQIGYKYIDNITFISMRMTTAFLTISIVFAARLIISKKYRVFIYASMKRGDTNWWKSMILGLLQYGFPHSMIALGQRTVASTIVTVVQPLVPTSSLLFASIFLADEKFTWAKLIPHVLAIIGCTLTCIPPFYNGGHIDPPKWYDLLMVFISVLSFGFGSVFFKMFQVQADFLACVFFQLLGATVYSQAFALIKIGPGENARLWFHTGKYIIYPLIIGIGYTSTSSAICLHIARVFGAVKSQLVNFGQIVIGVIAGVAFLHDFKGYTVWMHVVSWFGVVLLFISTILGFVVDHTEEVKLLHHADDEPVNSNPLLSNTNSEA